MREHSYCMAFNLKPLSCPVRTSAELAVGRKVSTQMTLDLLVSPHMIFDVSASTETDASKVIYDDTNASKVICSDDDFLTTANSTRVQTESQRR